MTRGGVAAAEDLAHAEFSHYQRTYVEAMRISLREQNGSRLHYAALPAYSHRNPLIRLVFWRRVRSVMDYLKKRGSFRSVLDFGCGAGVLLPFLAEHAKRVTAADVDTTALQAIARHIPLAPNVEVLDLESRSLSEIATQSCDLIVALDVLEHLDNLSGTAAALKRVLAPGGELIVSGPTENFAYKLGRFIAGRDFKGSYHVRSVDDVRLELAATFEVRMIGIIFRAMPLFITYSATRPVGAASTT
jgi:2-polyprenyl-3-methyl-5-hydroxy-6-metoxy-1,4-benzoquinol methylase